MSEPTALPAFPDELRHPERARCENDAAPMEVRDVRKADAFDGYRVEATKVRKWWRERAAELGFEIHTTYPNGDGSVTVSIRPQEVVD